MNQYLPKWVSAEGHTEQIRSLREIASEKGLESPHNFCLKQSVGFLPQVNICGLVNKDKRDGPPTNDFEVVFLKGLIFKDHQILALMGAVYKLKK